MVMYTIKSAVTKSAARRGPCKATGTFILVWTSGELLNGIYGVGVQVVLA